MPLILDDISQITLSTDEKITKSAVIQPFEEPLDSYSLKKHTWSPHSSATRRFFSKIHRFFFKRPHTQEKNLQLVLYQLLYIEKCHETFLGTELKKAYFIKAIEKTAKALHCNNFPLSAIESIHKEELAQMDVSESHEILQLFLENLKRIPLESSLKVESKNHLALQLTMSTEWGRCSIKNIDAKSGKVDCLCEKDYVLPNIYVARTKSVTNQCKVFDNKNLIGVYSGDIHTSFHVLEQILFILKPENVKEIFLNSHSSYTEEITILFTSLFSWKELEKIQLEHSAIENINRKILCFVPSGQPMRRLLIHCHYQNISSHMSPFAETKALLRDFNDETLIALTCALLHHYHFSLPSLFTIEQEVTAAYQERDFLMRKQMITDQIDQFRLIKDEIILFLNEKDLEEAKYLEALLRQDLPMIDELIYTSLITKKLGWFHTKSTEAQALDKAQCAFIKIYGHAYLPLNQGKEEQRLFKELFDLYMSEQPPILSC